MMGERADAGQREWRLQAQARAAGQRPAPLAALLRRSEARSLLSLEPVKAAGKCSFPPMRT